MIAATTAQPPPAPAASAGTSGRRRTRRARPSAPRAPGMPRPSGVRPPYRRHRRSGGPRPLPSQPVRPQQPARPARPGPACRRVRAVRRGRRVRPRSPGGSGASVRPRRDAAATRAARRARRSAPPPVTRTITLAEGMTVKDLADKLDVRVKDVLAKLLMKRMMMTINSTLDTETATMIAREFGADVADAQLRGGAARRSSRRTSKPEDLVTRAPVVTVMGHVDHGKTTLLDAIRATRVAEREAGGITQHIGAYHVHAGNGRNVVFLDTPGHEAFTLMRARGAKVTDIVVLVVAADDGVMPQTREAIDHAKAANVPIIVAINKIDKPDANPERVKRELTELGLMPEDWGGKTVMVEVSAKKKQNLDLLLEMILLVTDIGELKANPKRNASGTVLEAKLDNGRGPVATVLVQDGTLQRRRHVHRRHRSSARCARSSTTAAGRSKRRRPVDAGRSARPRRRCPRPATRSRSSTDAAKARQIAHVPPGAGQGQGARRQGRPPHARVAAGADRRRRHEGTADHHQGRRAGLGRSAGRHADEAAPTTRSRSGSSTPASAPSTSRTCCWPRRRTRSSSASTCGPIATPPTSPSARASTSASTRSSTT